MTEKPAPQTTAKEIAQLQGFSLDVRRDESGFFVVTSPQFPELHHATNSGFLGLVPALRDVPEAIISILNRRRGHD